MTHGQFLILYVMISLCISIYANLNENLLTMGYFEQLFVSFLVGFTWPCWLFIFFWLFQRLLKMHLVLSLYFFGSIAFFILLIYLDASTETIGDLLNAMIVSMLWGIFVLIEFYERFLHRRVKRFLSVFQSILNYRISDLKNLIKFKK